jgi:nucleoside-diphosphate-sugar epimerase
MSTKNILVIGAAGQIGSELTLAMRDRYGSSHVVAGRHIKPLCPEVQGSGPSAHIDCCRMETIAHVVRKYKIRTIYQLAAVLSAKGEANPLWAWDANMKGLINVLEIARQHGCSVFFPSSIGAFGPSTPLVNTPQDTIQRPGTIYGISKVAGELLCDYYHKKYGVDARGLRYPGIISNVTMPGGGTTDYAVEIFYRAIQSGKYVCYLKAGTYLDMMYMPDAISAAVSLMEADEDRLKHRNAYNVSAMSFDPEALAAAIRRHIPDFVMSYKIDPVRQAIADSWPEYMNDSAARREWGWSPEYDLKTMARDMIRVLSARLSPKGR